MNIILNGKVYKVLQKVLKGNNGICYVVFRDDIKMFLKLTSRDTEFKYNIQQLPQLYEFGTTIHFKRNYYYTLCEYIDGNNILKKMKLSTELFKSFIKLFVILHINGISIYDIKEDNFKIAKNNEIYYLDRGGLCAEETSYSVFNPMPYFDDPEEYYEKQADKCQNYDECLEVYYLGKMLIENFIITDKNISNIVNKMSSFYREERYKNFNEIELDARKII